VGLSVSVDASAAAMSASRDCGDERGEVEDAASRDFARGDIDAYSSQYMTTKRDNKLSYLCS
jgi:hypothetical protein